MSLVIKGNNLLVVDCLNLCFRFKHTLYKSEDVACPEWATLEDMVEVMREELAHVYFKDGFINTINSLAASYRCSNIIVAADLGSSAWRKALYPEYKGDRAKKYGDQPLVEQAIGKVFMEHYYKLLEDLKSEGINTMFSVGIEADDIVAYISLNHTHKYEHMWIVSSDGDLDLLLSNKVSRFNWATKNTWKNADKTGPRPKEVTLDNWKEHYEYPFEWHLDMKAIKGGEDNIIGVKGVGPKRAVDFLTKYSSVEGLTAALPLPGRAAYITELNAAGDRLKLNKKLMDMVTYNKDIMPLDLTRQIDALF